MDRASRQANRREDGEEAAAEHAACSDLYGEVRSGDDARRRRGDFGVARRRRREEGGSEDAFPLGPSKISGSALRSLYTGNFGLRVRLTIL